MGFPLKVSPGVSRRNITQGLVARVIAGVVKEELGAAYSFEEGLNRKILGGVVREVYALEWGVT